MNFVILRFKEKKISSGIPNSLDPNQALHSIHPDLGQNCFQDLSADDMLPLADKELRIIV